MLGRRDLQYAPEPESVSEMILCACWPSVRQDRPQVRQSDLLPDDTDDSLDDGSSHDSPRSDSPHGNSPRGNTGHGDSDDSSPRQPRHAATRR